MALALKQVDAIKAIVSRESLKKFKCHYPVLETIVATAQQKIILTSKINLKPKNIPIQKKGAKITVR